MKKRSKDVRIVSERFCSKYLNDGKLSLLQKVDADNIVLKNKMSELLFNNRHLLLTASKYDLAKMFASQFKSPYLKAWNVQTMFMDVAVIYMNYVCKLKANLQLKVVEKPATCIRYKKVNGRHRVGDLKEIIYHRHWTPFTKLLKALAFVDDPSSLNAELRPQHDFYVAKFGKKRMSDLVQSIKSNLLKKMHKIEFKTGTWRCCYSSNGKTVASSRFVDSTNVLFKHWMKIDLRKEFGSVYIPL